MNTKIRKNPYDAGNYCHLPCAFYIIPWRFGSNVPPVKGDVLPEIKNYSASECY